MFGEPSARNLNYLDPLKKEHVITNISLYTQHIRYIFICMILLFLIQYFKAINDFVNNEVNNFVCLRRSTHSN